MLFRQLIDPDLGCACYLLGDAGSAAVVDPGLDVERILAAAAEEGVRVEHVIETHVHADHVSGRALLAQRTGAAVHVPAGGGQEPGAGEPLRDGDAIDVGAVRITAVAAPGHRPEHLVLLVADRSRSAEPWMLLSGDSLLVGDLARPDLAVDAREGAAALHGTVERLAALSDAVELWPGHVGGSLCGGPGVSRKTSSTLGFERAVNPLLLASEQELTERLTASLPERPPTVERVVARNRSTTPEAGGAVPVLTPTALAREHEAGATLIDARAAASFDSAHVRGAVNLPLTGTGLGTRAAWVLDPDDAIVVLAESLADAEELTRRLRAVGLAGVRGVVAGDVRALADEAGLPIAAAAPIAIDQLPALAGELTIVDVRDATEWASGHLPGTLHIPLSELRARVGELPDGPLAVTCARGPRATFAASWLRARGHDARRVADGGVLDFPRLGLALVAA